MRHQKKRSPFSKSFEILGNIQNLTTSTVLFYQFCPSSWNINNNYIQQKLGGESKRYFEIRSKNVHTEKKTHLDEWWKGFTAQSTSLRTGGWFTVHLRTRCNGWLWGCNTNTAVWLEMKRWLNMYSALWLKLTQSRPQTISKDIVRKWRSRLPGGTVYHD